MAALRVLVTGAGGFIGRHVVAGRPPGWDVVALSRQAIEPGPGLQVVRSPGPDDELPAELARPFDAVIHLAGNADHGLAVRAPWADLAATGVASAAILGRLEARRLVVLSSAAVYAGRIGQVDPAEVADPAMAYALSKRYVEGFARALVATGRVESALVLRLYNAFGAGERPTRLIPRVARSVRAGEPFVLSGAADSLADPIHVDDVVRCLAAGVTAGGDGILDLCGGHPRPLRDAVGDIAGALGYPAPEIVERPDPDQVPIRFWSDMGPTIAALRTGAPEPFAEAVRRYGQAEGWLAGS